MYQNGHIGASLLVYAPLGFLAALIGGIEIAFVGAAVAAGLAPAPDIDMRIPLVPHRGPTHTVWFAGAVGIALAIVGGLVGAGQGILAAIGFALFGFLIGLLSIGSHLAADALTPMGIRPFTPYSSKRYTYDFVTAANPVANYGLLGLGVAAAGSAGAVARWLGTVF